MALAFLFAVFRSRPSPFYLMDEVEAALDDVNLQRFLGLVHEFRGEAQLIIVSHQKRTMEAADALYGVTMAPGGSSKVVSQKVPRDRVGPDLGVDEAAAASEAAAATEVGAATEAGDTAGVAAGGTAGVAAGDDLEGSEGDGSRPLVAPVRESVSAEDLPRTAASEAAEAAEPGVIADPAAELEPDGISADLGSDEPAGDAGRHRF